ncbi:hypothetical protein [Nonomuraea sp. NPDC049684]|uniref:hypothetical protein n=1 Tax=Nonomuraea sp. NPDC049684 TaxID=3364356 RepID=UPI0037A790CF
MERRGRQVALGLHLEPRGRDQRAEQVVADLVAAAGRAQDGLDLLVVCVVGAFMGLMRAWLDGATAASPAELDAAFRAAGTPGVRAVLGPSAGRGA